MLWSFTPALWLRTMRCDVVAMQCSPCHVDDFGKGQRASHVTFFQVINPDMTAICCQRFGNSTVIFLDLVNLGRDRRLCTIFEGNLIRFSAINEDRNDGCCLVHAINTTDGSIQMTVASKIITFVINTEIIHIEGLLLRLLRL